MPLPRRGMEQDVQRDDATVSRWRADAMMDVPADLIGDLTAACLREPGEYRPIFQ